MPWVCLHSLTWLSTLPWERIDAQLFMQISMLRIKQVDGFDISTVLTISPSR